MLIEMIAATLDDAIAIQNAGGNRIELVSALTEGGLTPSKGLIFLVSAGVTIPVNVMLRPHGKSFVYSANDLAVMKYDMSVILESKANGMVLGVLDSRGMIHTGHLEQLLAGIGGRSVTFHRAIDDTPDPVAAIKILAAYPEIKSVLTSGGKGSFAERMKRIRAMKEAAPHLEIVVGSGLTPHNIGEVHRLTATGAYHFGTAVRQEGSPLLGVDEASAAVLICLTDKLS